MLELQPTVRLNWASHGFMLLQSGAPALTSGCQFGGESRPHRAFIAQQ